MHISRASLSHETLRDISNVNSAREVCYNQLNFVYSMDCHRIHLNSLLKKCPLIVVAEYPSAANLRDGMLQRIASVDSILADWPRLYLEISFRHHWRPKIRQEHEVIILKLNYFLHYRLLLRVLRSARVTYIHSAYNALKIPFFRQSSTTIYDIHGVVPEENKACGRHLIAWILSGAERRCIKSTHAVVTVSKKMTQYYQKKYPHSARNTSYILLPILPSCDSDLVKTHSTMLLKRSPRSVIYAGGTQAWQNIDLMLDVCEANANFNYTFLTGNPDELNRKARLRNLASFSCMSVSPEKVSVYYRSHLYGFVLRANDIVNQVACPTKLVEYMLYGVIPIMLHDQVGDFGAGTIQAVSLEQFCSGNLPTDQELEGMRLFNQKAVEQLFGKAVKSGKLLRSVVDEALRAL